MLRKRQVYFRSLRWLPVIFLLSAACFFAEPLLRDNPTFAITYSDHPKVPTGHIDADFSTEEPQASRTTQRSHAPEPSTLFLFLSGVGGIIIRFAQRSFEKFKRILDLTLSIAGLLVSAPILAFCGLLVKLTSPGPIIYRQIRVGKDGKLFTIYKLRTMYIDAEKNTGAVWAKEHDPRVTPVGRILRKLHLDELPQIFNVIKAEMSIVGPRPERPEMVRDLKTLITDYEKRLRVKPGITGLAQVLHKYDETIDDVRKKIKYDLLYIRRMCWLLEMRILARTFVVALTGKGAR